MHAAMKDLNEAIDQSPGDAFLYRDQSALYEKQGKMESALNALTKFVELQPDEFYAYLDRASLYKRMGKPHLAAADFEKMRALCQTKELDYPNRGEYHYYEAIAYKVLGDLDAATREAERARAMGFRTDDWKQFGLK